MVGVIGVVGGGNGDFLFFDLHSLVGLVHFTIDLC